ncbi:MAG: hypothetical protein OXI59_13685 [Gemmatimonadota bacterium]|nr:hypothetical protein [Gemmatimonadota bacterium]
MAGFLTACVYVYDCEVCGRGNDPYVCMSLVGDVVGCMVFPGTVLVFPAYGQDAFIAVLIQTNAEGAQCDFGNCLDEQCS